jgi:DNA-binding transcriptional regulator YbjK
MVLLTDMGKKQIADAVLLVKADQEMAISHRNIAWHGGLPLGRVIVTASSL